MIYQLSQAQAALLARLRPLARDASSLLRSLHADRPEVSTLAQAAASLQLLEGAGTTHRKPAWLLSGSGVLAHLSHQSCNEGAKEGFAAAPGVVHELEEAEIQRQLLL